MRLEAIHDEPPLPWEQHEYPGRQMLGDLELHQRREGVFLFLASVFVTAVILLPVLGLDRGLDLSFTLGGEWFLPLSVPLGALAFPVALFCADLSCELFGRRRASQLVLVGIVVQAAVVALLWWIGALPQLETGAAYLARTLIALTINVQLFAWLRRRTRGRHLWTRNIVPTVFAQIGGAAAYALVASLVASETASQAIGGFEAALAGELSSGYVYALAAAIVDTIPLYLAVGALGLYLRIRRIDEQPSYTDAPLRPGARPSTDPSWTW
jgi:uncharacterized integral membrane protein (TIGR00697 family)